MKGDFTRFTFRPKQHYSSVRMQQGRVQTDADWNEQVDIQAHLLETATEDFIGITGAPRNVPNSFKVSYDQAPPTDLNIQPGRIYVDGILCELESPTSYLHQPDLPNPPALPDLTGVTYLAYLDVWQRHVTALEDPAIREVALGGPDSGTRVRTLWQLKVCLIMSTGQIVLPTSDAGRAPFLQSLDSLSAWQTTIAPSNATLSAKLVPNTGQPVENRLYRVEVHQGGTLGTDSVVLKWSRDNGAVVAPCTPQPSVMILPVGTVSADPTLGFGVDQTVEITDNAQELNAQHGEFHTIKAVTSTPTGLQLTFHENVQESFDGTAKVRRWDGVITVTTNLGTDIPLENGISIHLGAGTCKTGDYWLIPARSVNGGQIDWPMGTQMPPQPVPQQPQGIKHHYCKLAVLESSALYDCRFEFPSLANLTYADVDEVRQLIGDMGNRLGDLQEEVESAVTVTGLYNTSASYPDMVFQGDPARYSGWSEVPGGATSNVSDAAVVYGGRLYLFSIGVDGLHWVNTFDGTNWSGWNEVYGGSMGAIISDAAVAYGGMLYLFGIGTNDHGHYVNTFNGTTWSAWSPVPGGGTDGGGTQVADAAVVYGGMLYLFSIGRDGRHYVKTFDGTNWSAWSEVYGGSFGAVISDAAVVYGGKLYLFGIGTNDHGHYVNTFDGTNWTAWSLVPGSGTGGGGGTQVADAPVVYGGRLYLFSIGINDHRHYVSTFDGTNWTAWTAVNGNGTTLVSDGVAVYNDRLYLFGIGNSQKKHYVNIGVSVNQLAIQYADSSSGTQGPRYRFLSPPTVFVTPPGTLAYSLAPGATGFATALARVDRLFLPFPSSQSPPESGTWIASGRLSPVSGISAGRLPNGDINVYVNTRFQDTRRLSRRSGTWQSWVNHGFGQSAQCPFGSPVAFAKPPVNQVTYQGAFSRDTYGSLWMLRDDGSGQWTWGNPYGPPGFIVGPPSPLMMSGSLSVFVCSSNGHLYELTNLEQPGGYGNTIDHGRPLSSYTGVGQVDLVSNPCAVSAPDGHVGVLAVASDFNVYEWLPGNPNANPPVQPSWNYAGVIEPHWTAPPPNPPNRATTIAPAVIGADGQISVIISFCTDPLGSLDTWEFIRPSGATAWLPPTVLRFNANQTTPGWGDGGGNSREISGISAASTGEAGTNRRVAFAIGYDLAILKLNGETTLTNGTYSTTWTIARAANQLPGTTPVTVPAAIQYSPGQAGAFVVGANGHVYEIGPDGSISDHGRPW